MARPVCALCNYRMNPESLLYCPVFAKGPQSAGQSRLTAQMFTFSPPAVARLPKQHKGLFKVFKYTSHIQKNIEQLSMVVCENDSF